MRSSTLLTATMAATASAAAGVTFYEHKNFGGYSYQIPSANRCWPLPEPLFQKVSSVRFSTADVSCALYRNRHCFPPVLYAGLRHSISNLHDIGLGDEIGGVYCGVINHEDK